MNILALIVIGAAAGFVATRLMRIEAGLVPTVAVGILGALAGGLVLRAVVAVTGWLAGFLGAVLGAMVLIWLWRQFAARR